MCLDFLKALIDKMGNPLIMIYRLFWVGIAVKYSRNCASAVPRETPPPLCVF